MEKAYNYQCCKETILKIRISQYYSIKNRYCSRNRKQHGSFRCSMWSSSTIESYEQIENKYNYSYDKKIFHNVS